MVNGGGRNWRLRIRISMAAVGTGAVQQVFVALQQISSILCEDKRPNIISHRRRASALIQSRVKEVRRRRRLGRQACCIRTANHKGWAAISLGKLPAAGGWCVALSGYLTEGTAAQH